MNDSQIIDLYWQRNEKAIEETELKYNSYCFAVAHNILTDEEDSRECVNDTWLRTWNSIPPKRPDNLRIFLAKITRNLSFDRYRAKNTLKRGGGEIAAVLEELDGCIKGADDVQTELELTELKADINSFLFSLPQLECSIFLRRFFYVESISQIALRFHLREGHVAVILSRTRKKLKHYLEAKGYII